VVGASANERKPAYAIPSYLRSQAWRISGADGTALWDGVREPAAQTADGEPVPAVPGTGPEEIAGSLAEFVAALRERTVPSTEVHRNVMSLAMVEGAVRSAQTGRRAVLAGLLDEAYEHALATERRPQLLAVLPSWPSVHEVIADSTPAVPHGQLNRGTR
jgi:hypothetical protein